MSYERALRAINLERTDKIAQAEMLGHPDFVEKLTGIDAYQFPAKAFAEAYKRLDVDIVWDLPSASTRFGEGEVMRDEKGRLRTRWGVDAGAYWESDTQFHDVEDVFAYDPFECSTGDYTRFLPVDPRKSVEEMAEGFAAELKEKQDLLGRSALVPGYHYFTLFHYFVTTFGWELTSYAALRHRDRFRQVIERFAELSIKICEAWSRVDFELFLSHDDLAMNTGPIFSPDWYRENIFPWYPEIWRSLKKSGKKIFFISDGDITSLLDDLMACGMDGIFLESMVSLEDVARKYGSSKFIVGNVDTRVLTFGGQDDIEEEIKRCVAAAGDCAGYILCATGSIPHNVPLENVEIYFRLCERYRR